MSLETDVKNLSATGSYGNSVTGAEKENTPLVVEPVGEDSPLPKDSLTHDGRVSPVTLKLTKNYDNNGSMLEMVVEKVKARENSGVLSSSPSPVPKPMPLVVANEEKTLPEKKRRASNDSDNSSITKASESNTEDIKDDDDENDDDEDKISPGENIDPERLKAFNMFVRLFVDENLDRTVPISKQPKDKIQAILEACDRQFAEFHDRSRKRVRTYLKSCRRLKRCKDGNGFEQVKQTPPHLTSAAAESILAQACENESQNAKRMRMGLEPLPSHLMNASTRSSTPTPPINQPKQEQQQHSQHHVQPIINSSITRPSSRDTITASTPRSHHESSRSQNIDVISRKRNSDTPDYCQLPTKIPSNSSSFRPPHDMTSPFNLTNGTGLFRSGFPSSSFNTPPAHHHASSLLQNSLSSQLQNGPTDLSMKKSPVPGGVSKKPQLSVQEVTTIKSLIAGYRESAAFLYRSADELEQLLQQQQ